MTTPPPGRGACGTAPARPSRDTSDPFARGRSDIWPQHVACSPTDLLLYNNTGFIDMETNYQSGDVAPVGYPATAVKNIVFTGNRALGGGTGASFVCSVKDACENITVTNNTVANNPNPWHCNKNTGEDSLETCMKNSMHPKEQVHLSYEQRKQAAIRAWEERGQ
eukprot:gene30340-biopygen47342